MLEQHYRNAASLVDKKKKLLMVDKKIAIWYV